MCFPVLKSFVFRKSLREGSYTIGWIILVIKASLWLVGCIALDDMYAVKNLKNIEINERYHFRTDLPEHEKMLLDEINVLIGILWSDMLVYLAEMLLSLGLLNDLAKERWALVRTFYFIYPFFMLANIVITGIRVSKTNPRNIYPQISQAYGVLRLPYERYTQCAIIVFTFFELYALMVVRSCFWEEDHRGEDFLPTMSPHSDSRPPTQPLGQNVMIAEPIYSQ